MLFELIAVLSAGFVGGGAVLLARRVYKPLPRALIPIGAGAAMLLVAIALEYAWFQRTQDALPDGVEVALTHESRAPWRPWTYLRPFVDSFVAVDTNSLREHDAAPRQRMVDLVVFTRWNAPRAIRAVFDCEEGRRADIGPGAQLSDDGTVTGAAWHETGLDHPVTARVCA